MVFKVNAKRAFTLAEVLIVIGIIGLIADMTIPTLISEFNVKAAVAQLKTSYSVLSGAFRMAMIENGPPSDWGLNAMYDENVHKTVAKNLTNHLKVIRDCANDTDNSKCLGNTNDLNSLPKTNGSSFILANGTTVFVRSWGSCEVSQGTTKALNEICGTIKVDINGQKKPNKNGVDVFDFYFTNQGIIPVGGQEDNISFAKNCLRTEPADEGMDVLISCTAWVIYNENMDYLKCKDLSWQGKTKCN